MTFQRSSGILLHPTSLPGPYGIGDFGSTAKQWVDFLDDSGTGLWQVLPLGPTGYGDSPYQCFSTFAGNPYLISPDALLEQDLLHKNDLADKPDFSTNFVEYEKIIYWKLDLLNRSFDHFRFQGDKKFQQKFEQFQIGNAPWLNDYALFMALKEYYGGKPWSQWPAYIRDRNPEVLDKFRIDHEYAIKKQTYFQFIFFQQWRSLRTYANKKGVKIIGDLPIYIAHDSADAWAHQDYFYLDDKGLPTVMSGVPPDYYSETGQLWGNPIYRWDKHAADGFEWWMTRLRSAFAMVDILRLDHFRGFVGYWEVPAGENTAVKGRWVDGPGSSFLNRVEAEFRELPIIAEDLGEITPDVIELRDQFKLPGMKILVFAFDSGEKNIFLPHHYLENSVVYTGTHDNDTAVGWFKRIEQGERTFAQRYLQSSGEDIAWDLINAAWSSKAVYAITPLQDLLSLDNRARMNYPGNPHGNWRWRFRDSDLSEEICARLRDMNYLYGRSNTLIVDHS